MADITSAQLQSAIDSLQGAAAEGNLAKFQEAIREYNLTYANNVAQLYGQNYGPGQPAPVGASTMAAGQQFGSIGYIPGYSGPDVGQTMAQLGQSQTMAQNAAGMTGFYAAPTQSAYTPGTFVRLDPNTYDTRQYGPVQMSYVLPSGQMQRVTIPQAQAMGWNGNLGMMNVLPAQQAIMLEKAPPQNAPQQTLQGLAGYSNLNAQGMNQALAQAGVTGMYSAPQPVMPPGTNWSGGRFGDLPAETQQAYFMSNGSDWNAAMNKWVADSNRAIQQAGGAAPQAGTPQMTLQAQNQYFTQDLDVAKLASSLQANPFRQQQVLGQAQQILSRQPMASFQAPNTVQGVGTAGGNQYGGMGYLQQMIDDIKNPVPNQTSADQFLQQTPTPNKLDSTSFIKAAPSTQNILLQAMQEKYGIDPKDALTQIQNTLPQFQAPTFAGTVKR